MNYEMQVFTVSNLHDTLQYYEMLTGERRPSQMPAISTTAQSTHTTHW